MIVYGNMSPDKACIAINLDSSMVYSVDSLGRIINKQSKKPLGYWFISYYDYCINAIPNKYKTVSDIPSGIDINIAFYKKHVHDFTKDKFNSDSDRNYIEVLKQNRLNQLRARGFFSVLNPLGNLVFNPELFNLAIQIMDGNY